MIRKLVITGTSRGIGEAIALKFLGLDWEVEGIDTNTASTVLSRYPRYTHHIADISNAEELPDIPDATVLINNAGVQTGSERDIDVNLKGAINVTRKYVKPLDKTLVQSVLFIGSVSAHTGWEFPFYVASKAGLQGYMKSVAVQAAKKGITVNSLDPGGVVTELNAPVLKDGEMWSKIMEATPLKRWAYPEEIAEWAYFLTVGQSFCTGQCIIVDGGEKDLNSTFVWPGY